MTDFLFDGPNKIILEPSGVGDTEFDVDRDLYSAWKRWLMLGDNAKYLEAVSVVGGDAISSTQNLGSTYFLENGWRIRPDEHSHKITIVGNLFTREEGETVFLNTLGAYTVQTEMRVSSLVDSSVSRLDLTQLLQAVYVNTVTGVAGTAVGIGTPTNPVNNLADARAIADRDNLQEFVMYGTFTLDQNYDNWTFTGSGSGQYTVIDLGGYSCDGASFNMMVLTGSVGGNFKADGCGLNLSSNVEGLFTNCGLLNSVTLRAGAKVIMSNCYSATAGLQIPEIVFGGDNELAVRNYSGGIALYGMISGDIASIDLDPGSCVIDSTCVGGAINIRGVGSLEDNSTGTVVSSDGLLQQGSSGGLTAAQNDALLLARDHARATNAQTQQP